MNQKFMAFIFKCFLVLIFSEVCALEQDEPSSLPKYIVTIPVFVPSTLDPDLESDGEDDSNIPAAYFKSPPYVIDSSRRGKIELLDPEDSDAPNDASRIIEALENRFSQESFGKTKEESEEVFSARGALSLLLNRLKSLSSQKNQVLTKKYINDSKTKNLRVTRAFWTLEWKKITRTDTGQRREKYVSYEEVLKFYRAFKKFNKAKAICFLREQEERSFSSSIPYRELRETIKNHANTQELIRLLRSTFRLTPIYLGIFDADVVGLRSGTDSSIGVFTVYDRLIQTHWHIKHRLPHLMSTGYAPSPDPFEDKNRFHFLDVGLELDRMVRQAIFSVFANGLYYPEPNSLILILEECSTVMESFLHQNDLNYEFPQEMLIMSEHLIANRYLIPNDAFIFDGRFPIVTRAPERMLTYRKNGKKTPFKIMCIWDCQRQKFIFWTETDFTNFPQIAQSHLNVYAGWTQNVLRALEKLFKKKPTYPLSKEIKYAHQKRISLLSTLLASYDPFSISSFSENFDKTIKNLVEDYRGHTPGPLRVTYDPKPSKSSKKIGPPKLSQHQVDFQEWISTFQTISDLKSGIDRFFIEPVADQLEEAARKSGEAICLILRHYFAFDFRQFSGSDPSTPSPIIRASQEETPPDRSLILNQVSKKSSRELFPASHKEKIYQKEQATEETLAAPVIKVKELEDDSPSSPTLTLSPSELFLENFFQRPYERSNVTLLLNSLTNTSHLASYIKRDKSILSKLKKPEKYGPLESNSRLVWGLFKDKSIDEIKKILDLQNTDSLAKKIEHYEIKQ